MLLTSVSFRSVSRSFPWISEQSVSRHVANHLRSEVAAALRTSGAVRTSDLIQRLASIADDAADLRKDAMAKGDVLNALRASDAETRSLAVLLDRLGIGSSDAISLLAAGEALARALGEASRAEPRVAVAVSQRLRAMGFADDADALLRVAESQHFTIQETNQRNIQQGGTSL